jgi:hypothetical protein
MNSRHTKPPADDASRNAEIEAAWREYLAARAPVDHTLELADAIAAGKSWSRFLSLFTGEAA